MAAEKNVSKEEGFTWMDWNSDQNWMWFGVGMVESQNWRIKSDNSIQLLNMNQKTKGLHCKNGIFRE